MPEKNNQYLARLWNNFLDLMAPVDAWIAQKIYFRFWTSNQAKKSVNNLRKPRLIFLRAKSTFYSWDIPENWRKALFFSFFIAFSPMLIIEILLTSHIIKLDHIYQLNTLSMSTVLSTGWQVLASLIGITFVIVIFLVQYANEKEYERRAFPIFIQETHMILTATFNLITLLFNGASLVFLSLENINQELLTIIIYYNFFLFIVNVFLILRLFISTIRMIIPSYFREKFILYSRKQTSALVEVELINRFSNNVLKKRFSDFGIDYSFFTPKSRGDKNFVSINNLSREIQVITDINTKLIEVAIKRSQKILPTFSKQDLIFFGNLDHRVGKERPEIALLSPILDRPYITQYLLKSIRYLPIKEIEKHDLSEEMFINRDLISSAIQAKQADVVEELLDQYQTIIISFLEIITKYGVQYSLNLAKREDGFFSDWKILSTIQDHYRNLIKHAFESNDNEISRSFISFPFHILANTIRYRDHLVYKRFSELIIAVYHNALSIGDSVKQELIIELFSRLIAEHLTYILIPTIEKTADVEDLDQLTDYLIQINIIMNDLCKISINHKNLIRFQSFLSISKLTLSKFFPSVDKAHLDILNFQIESIPNEEDKKTILSKYVLHKKASDLKNKINQTQSLMFLGLGAWLSHLFDLEIINLDEFLSFSNVIKIGFNNIEFLNCVFSDIAGREKAEEEFKWKSWEMEEWDESLGEIKTGFLRFDSWLLRYYLICVYELLPHDLSVLPRIKPTNQSQAILENIKSDINSIKENDKWRKLFDSFNAVNYEKRIEALIVIHEKAAVEQSIIEETYIIETPISNEKIESFKNDLIENWEKSGLIRLLARKFGNYQEFPEIINREQGKVFGINELSPKGAFINQNRVTYLDWGATYGRSLANSEDNLLWAQFKNHAVHSFQEGNFEETVKACLLDSIFIDSKIVFLFNGTTIMRLFHESKNFIPAWRIEKSTFDIIGFTGLFNQIPVFRFDPIKDDSLTLFDIKGYGVLSQYGVSGSTGFPLSISINEITNDQAEKILNKNPEWYKNPKTGSQEDKGTSIRRILQHVSIQIWECCLLEKVNPLYIRKFKLEQF